MHHVVLFSKETNEIAIKNFLRHSVIKGGKPVEDCILSDLAKVKDKSLIARVFGYLETKEGLNATVNKIISEYEIDNVNDNENDNDNDVSSVRYVDESWTYRQKTAKPVKHKHGEYRNVLLTDAELEKLKAEYPDWEDRIERLSSYVASTGKSYKSHYATIRNWARKDQNGRNGSNEGASGNHVPNKPKVGHYI